MGEPVAVLTRRRAGEDAMGEPVWEWGSETVEGCLVRPLAGEDMGRAEAPDGVIAEYSVAFPKTFAGELRHARLALVGRGMDAADPDSALRVSGSPDRTRPCPTAWDLVAVAGRAHG